LTFKLRTITRPNNAEEKPVFYFNPAYRKPNLAKFFDKNGKPRKWSGYLYVDAQGKKVEISISDMRVKSKEPEFRNLKFIEWIDEGEYYSELSNPAIETTLRKLMDIRYLVDYYTAKCPEGDLHNIVSGVCTKCDLGKLSQEAYYKKYRHRYQELISFDIERDNTLLDLLYLRKTVPAPPKLSQWVVTQEHILRWSKESKIDFHKINSVGLYWRCSLEDMKQAKCDPFANITEDDMKYRLSLLRSYYMFVVRTCNRIKYDSMAGFIDAELSNILNRYKNKLQGLGNKMPSIQQELVLLQIRQEEKKSVDVACNFAISSLANLLLQIKMIEPHDFALDLFNLLTNYIIRMETLSMKPPPYVRPSKAQKVKTVADLYASSDDEDNGTIRANGPDDFIEAFSDAEVQEKPFVPSEEIEDYQDQDADLFSFNDSDIIDVNNGNDDTENED
jgi:hypothetical protein